MGKEIAMGRCEVWTKNSHLIKKKAHAGGEGAEQLSRRESKPCSGCEEDSLIDSVLTISLQHTMGNLFYLDPITVWTTGLNWLTLD